MDNKNTNLKEKLRQALSSTARVISGDFKIKDGLDKNKDHHKLNFFDIENLNSKTDYIKARADSDSFALKKNFLMIKYIKKIYLLTHLVNHFTL